MTDTLAQYIPHSKKAEFERDGWTVKPMPLPHGFYSLLATKKVSK